MELIKVRNPKNHTVVVAGKHLKPGAVMDLPRTEIVLYALKVGLLEEVPPAQEKSVKQQQETAKPETAKPETAKSTKKEEKKKK
jgi:hypothetical protein